MVPGPGPGRGPGPGGAGAWCVVDALHTHKSSRRDPWHPLMLFKSFREMRNPIPKYLHGQHRVATRKVHT